MMQLIDADTSLRIDLFRANGGIMTRAISVEGPPRGLRVISVEDVLAHEARLLLDLDANAPVAAKHADDYLRLVELVKFAQHGTCVAGSPEADAPDDIPRDPQITQRLDRDSSQPADHSRLFEGCRRDLLPLCTNSSIPVG